MKKLKAEQKAKGVKELSADEAEQVTCGNFNMKNGCWEDPNNPLGDLEKTLGKNEGPEGTQTPFIGM